MKLSSYRLIPLSAFGIGTCKPSKWNVIATVLYTHTDVMRPLAACTKKTHLNTLKTSNSGKCTAEGCFSCSRAALILKSQDAIKKRREREKDVRDFFPRLPAGKAPTSRFAIFYFSSRQQLPPNLLEPERNFLSANKFCQRLLKNETLCRRWLLLGTIFRQREYKLAGRFMSPICQITF